MGRDAAAVLHPVSVLSMTAHTFCTGRHLYCVRGHTGEVTGVAVDPTGMVLASTGQPPVTCSLVLLPSRYLAFVVVVADRCTSGWGTPGNDCVTKWWSVQTRTLLDEQTVREGVCVCACVCAASAVRSHWLF